MTAGLCSALGTILITTRMAAIYSSVNSTLLLDGVAAAVLGGTSITGGGLPPIFVPSTELVEEAS